MKVILREEVENLGNAGDLVNVKPGYARNYLFPRSLAVRANERNVAQLQHDQRAMEARRVKLLQEAKAASKQLDGVGRVVITKACGPEGKLFGSVTAADISGAFNERGVVVSKKQVALAESLRQLGDYDVAIKLGQGVTVEVKVSVEPDAASAELIAKAVADAAEAASAAPAPYAEA